MQVLGLCMHSDSNLFDPNGYARWVPRSWESISAFHPLPSRHDQEGHQDWQEVYLKRCLFSPTLVHASFEKCLSCFSFERSKCSFCFQSGCHRSWCISVHRSWGNDTWFHSYYERYRKVSGGLVEYLCCTARIKPGPCSKGYRHCKGVCNR